MPSIPPSVSAFLSGKRIAVAGVSRQPSQVANAIFRRLRDSGFEAIPVNPNATELEGTVCYPDIASIPGTIDGVMVATHPDTSRDVVRQAADRGVRQIWFHRSFGDGSVSKEALDECATRGIEPIVGGCPLMYCQPVDIGHRCMCWLLRRMHRVPA